jgi:hypothetical protein
MAFLAPAFLFLAALAGVPLLVHLLRRRITRTVDFPAVRYLTRMEKEHSRERKLRHRLLLFLRMLAVLALALAAARPIARLAGLGHAPVAVAVLLDNSMSSGAAHDGRVVLDDLRADARSLLRSLSPDDRAWLVTADGRVIGGSISSLEDALTAVRPLGGRGDIASATRRAITLVRSGAPRAPVVAIVGDNQANTWAAAANDTATARPVDAGQVPVQLLIRSSATRNAAVVDIRAEPARWTPTGSVSFAIVSPDSAPWRIALDGRTIARGTVAPSTADAPVRIAQKLASATSGWIRGSVELDADELRGDDTRWFAARVAPPPTVVARAEAGQFLSAALATLVEEKRLDRAALGAQNVVTVSGADAPINSRPVFLTAPSDPVRVGEANRTLARLGIPWRFGAIARDLVLVRGAPTLEGVQVRLRYPLQRSAGGAAAGLTDTIATAGGTPWAVAGDGYVLLASPIDPDATDLPLRAGFVPWLLDALSRRLGDDGQVLQAAPGQMLIDRSLGTATGLERPDRTVIPIAGDRLTVPNESGVYFLRRQATRVGAIVVNPEAQESDVRGDATGRVFRTRVTGRFIGVDSSSAEWRSHALDQAAGRSFLLPLVALALLALLLEAWFSRGASAPSPDRREPQTVARAA